MVISSRHNPRVREVALLKDKKHRERTGLYLVEGEKSVREAFAYQREVVTVLGVEDLVKDYLSTGAEVIPVTKEIANYVSDSVTPQGIVAVVKMGENRLIAPHLSSVLLDGVQDPGNLGTIIRTCAAAGIKDIYLADTADPYSPKTVRASMSGIFSVNLHRGKREDILKILSDEVIICADMNGQDIFTYTPPKKYCLAVGSEAHGLSDAVRKAASVTVKIPMESCMESLNAGVAASIILYQLKIRS